MSSHLFLLLAALTFPGEYQIRGVVRGPDAQPVTGADVWLVTTGNPVPLEERDALHTTTDQEGRFALPLPVHSPYGRNFQIDAFAFKPGVGIASTYVDARSPPLHTLTLRLKACAPDNVTIVDPSGAPLKDARVTVSNMTARSEKFIQLLPASPPVPFRSQTDARGEVTLELFKSLSWVNLDVETPQFGIQRLSAHDSLLESPLSLVRPGKVRGRLVADDPKLLAGVLVSFQSQMEPQSRRLAVSVKGRADVRTDAEGRFEVAALVPGNVQVVWIERATGPSVFLGADVQGKLQPEGILDIEIPVIGGVRVSGAVVQDESGVPCPAIPVHISIRSDDRYSGSSRTVLTDREGHYETFMPPAAGYVMLEVGPLPDPWLPADASPLNRRIPAAGDELAMPDFILQRGTSLTGKVMDANARPVPYAYVQAATVGIGKKNVRRVLVESDANGSFTIGPMDPDLVVAMMASNDDEASAAVLMVEPGKARLGIVLRIEAAAMAEVSGRLVDTEGHPVSRDDIVLDSGMDSGEWECDAVRALQPISSQFVTTDAQGKYAFPNRIPRLGRYWLQTLSINRFARKRLVLEGGDLQAGRQSLEDIVLEREK
ncbi:MAG: carboxypeptidase regulatory-like domain-containing protein [Planctomycetes bacterium]|nr:carboxypeptidase regulatory-like domain-containing protein [Planctomycetota bacterium]